jgi:hypothetical protein
MLVLLKDLNRRQDVNLAKLLVSRRAGGATDIHGSLRATSGIVGSRNDRNRKAVRAFGKVPERSEKRPIVRPPPPAMTCMYWVGIVGMRWNTASTIPR